jgi:hypothetical protein
LLALPGDPPPVGKSLEVRINHPTVDETLVVPGKVARHVEASGSICIGIQFQVPEAREDEVAEFINRVRAIEHSRRLGGINGPIADLGIRNLLAMFGGTAPVGMLTLTRGPDEGYITIDHGQLRAQLGGSSGRPALDELLSWSDGSFEFEAQIDDGLVDGEVIPVSEIALGGAVEAAPPAEPAPAPDPLPDVASADVDTNDDSQSQPLELMDLDDLDLDLDLLPELDPDGLEDDLEERMQIDAAPISPDATLCASPGGDRSDLSKTEEAILDLAAVGMTVAKAVDIIPESDVDVYAAIQNLLDEGHLTLD